MRSGIQERVPVILMSSCRRIFSVPLQWETHYGAMGKTYRCDDCRTMVSWLSQQHAFGVAMW